MITLARICLTPVIALLMFAGPGFEWCARQLGRVQNPARLRLLLYGSTFVWLAIVPLMVSTPSLGLLAEKMRSVTPLPRFDPGTHDVDAWLRANNARDGAIVLAGNVGTCALDALAAARMPMYYPEQLTGDMTQHRLKQVYLFSTHQPNHWVDVSDYMQKKLEALHCHTSQVSDGVDEIVRQRASIIGVEHGYKYGESFHHLALR